MTFEKMSHHGGDIGGHITNGFYPTESTVEVREVADDEADPLDHDRDGDGEVDSAPPSHVG